MQVTNEVWRREAESGRTELAVVLFTPSNIVVTYTAEVIRTEEFDSRNDGDAEMIAAGLGDMGYQLVLETRFLV